MGLTRAILDQSRQLLCYCDPWGLLANFQDTLPLQMVAEHVEKCELFFRTHGHAELKKFVRRCHVDNERRHVDIDKGRHEELAIETVHDATMSWDGIAKVLERKFQFAFLDSGGFGTTYWVWLLS